MGINLVLKLLENSHLFCRKSNEAASGRLIAYSLSSGISSGCAA